MDLVCLDLEGVLIPEIWIAFAEETGIASLRATTRDIPDYNELMATTFADLRLPRPYVARNSAGDQWVIPVRGRICLFGGSQKGLPGGDSIGHVL